VKITPLKASGVSAPIEPKGHCLGDAGQEVVGILTQSYGPDHSHWPDFEAVIGVQQRWRTEIEVPMQSIANHACQESIHAIVLLVASHDFLFLGTR
jgi:hypothetical protein